MYFNIDDTLRYDNDTGLRLTITIVAATIVEKRIVAKRIVEFIHFYNHVLWREAGDQDPHG